MGTQPVASERGGSGKRSRGSGKRSRKGLPKSKLTNHTAISGHAPPPRTLSRLGVMDQAKTREFADGHKSLAENLF